MSIDADVRWTPEAGEILTIAELLSLARGLLEQQFPVVWVEGEISNVRIPGSGHAYFTLGDERAQVRAVCFRSTLRLLACTPEDGQRVLARGRLTLYEARGDVQLVVEDLEPHGAGLLRLEFEARKRRLAAEGLFEAGRKRPLPHLPATIGVVTSPSGAAIRDILQVLGRRAPGVHVVLSPARVQGEGAGAEIRTALETLVSAANPDVVILGRGGGSYEDLWEFNDEGLVRAVAACGVPTISAVGHEVDLALTDFAADVRAPTPSAAAELAVQEWATWSGRVGQAERHLAEAVGRRIRSLRSRLAAADPALRAPRAPIARCRILLDRALDRARDALRRRIGLTAKRLAVCEDGLARRSPRARLLAAASTLREQEARLLPAMRRAVRLRRDEVGMREAQLAALSPLGILRRGYAVARTPTGQVIRDARACRTGDDLRLTLARGELGCRVIDGGRNGGEG